MLLSVFFSQMRDLEEFDTMQPAVVVRSIPNMSHLGSLFWNSFRRRTSRRNGKPAVVFRAALGSGVIYLWLVSGGKEKYSTNDTEERQEKLNAAYCMQKCYS